MRLSSDDLATRRAYDAVAVDYARLVLGMSLEAPWDRAVLGAITWVHENGNDALDLPSVLLNTTLRSLVTSQSASPTCLSPWSSYQRMRWTACVAPVDR